MFVLRKISGDGIEMNFSLGSNYTLTLKSKNPEEFKKVSMAVWKEPEPENTYGYVADDTGTYHCLFRGQFNYIMSGHGETFDNISE